MKKTEAKYPFVNNEEDLLKQKVVFHIARFWSPEADRKIRIDLYNEIKVGKKDFELRNNKKYWRKKLLGEQQPQKAWFVAGYPKRNLPRLEADITRITEKEVYGKIKVYFANVKEIEQEEVKNTK
jgi:hypothetical protein